MSHTMSNVGSAMNLCARYTAALVSNLRGVVSILPTSNLSSRALNSHTGIALSSVNKAAFIPLPILRSVTFIIRHAVLSRTYVNELD